MTLRLVTWHLRHWLHFWPLRTTILTFTLWPLNKEWWWQHSQFLRCSYIRNSTQVVTFERIKITIIKLNSILSKIRNFGYIFRFLNHAMFNVENLSWKEEERHLWSSFLLYTAGIGNLFHPSHITKYTLVSHFWGLFESKAVFQCANLRF